MNNWNRNRGYQNLNVWKESIELMALSHQLLKDHPFYMAKIVGNQLSSVDSIHRNIAEGYCRKSTREYLNFLNYCISSLGESVSGMIALNRIEFVSCQGFEKWEASAFKVENGILKLIDKLNDKIK